MKPKFFWLLAVYTYLCVELICGKTCLQLYSISIIHFSSLKMLWSRTTLLQSSVTFSYNASLQTTKWNGKFTSPFVKEQHPCIISNSSVDWSCSPGALNWEGWLEALYCTALDVRICASRLIRKKLGHLRFHGLTLNSKPINDLLQIIAISIF